VTVTRDDKNWDISVQVEQEISDPCPVREPSTGLDIGIYRLYTCSDGSFAKPLNPFRSLEEKLSREQRKLSRKKQFSKNWKKQKAKVAKVHRKIRDSRLKFLHKHSTATQVGKELGVAKSRTTALVNVLVCKGLFQRNTDPHDAGLRLVTLTRYEEKKLRAVLEYQATLKYSAEASV
jgi:transposase